MSQPRRASALFLEGVVIVVSILLAFFLEGWGEDRDLARELRQELISVRTELERNRELVAVEIVAIDRQISGLSALVQTIDAAGGAGLITVPDTLAWLSTGWNLSLNPSIGAVTALIASGRLARVQQAELRIGLAGLDEALADVIEEELYARQIAMEHLAPLLGQSIRLDYSIGNEFFQSAGEGLTVQERVRAQPFPSRGMVEFPTTLPIRNAITLRLAWLSSGRGELASLRTRLDDLIAMTTDEIGR